MFSTQGLFPAWQGLLITPCCEGVAPGFRVFRDPPDPRHAGDSGSPGDWRLRQAIGKRRLACHATGHTEAYAHFSPIRPASRPDDWRRGIATHCFPFPLTAACHCLLSLGVACALETIRPYPSVLVFQSFPASKPLPAILPNALSDPSVCGSLRASLSVSLETIMPRPSRPFSTRYGASTAFAGRFPVSDPLPHDLRCVLSPPKRSRITRENTAVLPISGNSKNPS